MTAIDIAVQSKRLGASRVDLVYRRGPEQMGASGFEQDLAQTNGVTHSSLGAADRNWSATVTLRRSSLSARE